jgi:acyl-coenzyme A thioesterase PaaI-like protein
MSLPPYATKLGATAEMTEEGPVVRMLPGDHLVGRPDFIHGGAIAGLLEIAAFAGLAHALDDENRPRIKPITVTVDFRRGGRLVETYAIGEVTRLGHRIANVAATAWQEDRAKPIATAQMNFLLDREITG